MAEGWKSNRARVVQAFVRKNLLSLDHKMIGKQYYAPALVAVFIGMVLSWLMRIHVAWPSVPIPGLRFLSGAGAPAGVMTPEYYLSLMTMHGTLMIFFVLTNAPFAGFGTYFLPIQIGARRMLHKFITVAALVTGAAQFIFFYNPIWSYFRGRPASANPWEATSLEWSLPRWTNSPGSLSCTAIRTGMGLTDQAATMFCRTRPRT